MIVRGEKSRREIAWQEGRELRIGEKDEVVSVNV